MPSSAATDAAARINNARIVGRRAPKETLRNTVAANVAISLRSRHTADEDESPSQRRKPSQLDRGLGDAVMGWRWGQGVRPLYSLVSASFGPEEMFEIASKPYKKPR